MANVLHHLDLVFETFEDPVLRYICSAMYVYLTEMAVTMQSIDYMYRVCHGWVCVRIFHNLYWRECADCWNTQKSITEVAYILAY